MSNGSVRSVPEGDNGLWWDHRNGDRLYLNIRGKGVYKLTMTTQNTIADGFVF